MPPHSVLSVPPPPTHHPPRSPVPQFCLLEPELLCRLVFVKDIECQPAAGEQQAAQGTQQGGRAPPGTTELPTCPVCLERLDEHISGIVTTVGPCRGCSWCAVAGGSALGRGLACRGCCSGVVARAEAGGAGKDGRAPWLHASSPACANSILARTAGLSQRLGPAHPHPTPALLWQVCNHRFHNECLRQWGDTSCPVCRYCQHSIATTSHCSVCSTSAGGLGRAGRWQGRLSIPPLAPAVQSLLGAALSSAAIAYGQLLCSRPAPALCRPVDLPDLWARGVRAVPRLARRLALAVQRARLRAGAGDAGGWGPVERMEVGFVYKVAD